MKEEHDKKIGRIEKIIKQLQVRYESIKERILKSKYHNCGWVFQ